MSSWCVLMDACVYVKVAERCVDRTKNNRHTPLVIMSQKQFFFAPAMQQQVNNEIVGGVRMERRCQTSQHICKNNSKTSCGLISHVDEQHDQQAAGL